MTDSVTSQIGVEAWVNNPPTEISTQIGTIVFYGAASANTVLRTSQIGSEAWYALGTVYVSSQIGIEVWRSVADMSKGGFNMPMQGM